MDELEVVDIDEFGHMDGCCGSGHKRCRGELWTCSSCKQSFCFVEGSTDEMDLCDVCWFLAQQGIQVP